VAGNVTIGRSDRIKQPAAINMARALRGLAQIGGSAT
jgi:hypothetical protein